jgi:2-haloacid dehalogenase
LPVRNHVTDRAEHWLTFDCFGTLVDWRTGIARAIDSVAPGQSARLLPLYYLQEAEVQAEPFRLYRDVLDEALKRTAAEAHVTIEPGREHVLSDSLPTWPVFADVGPALTELRHEGWKLGILSNVDGDLFARTREQLPVPIDAVVTAQDVGSYKPAPGHFLRFVETYEPATHIHVAQSWFHDIEPAHRFGIQSIWINRLDEHNDPSIAAAVLPDLRGLPQTIGRLSERAMP